MIRQRLLYVGIGGSGLDLGISLDEALRREICGLDGRALRQKSVVFADFKPNQLPDFIQSIYIDFAAAALQNVTSGIKGGNAHAAGNIIPRAASYPLCAAQLRTGAWDFVSGWLPDERDDGGEPLVNPLSGGAGQYPTVGRAALFHSLTFTGYAAALGDKIKAALTGLDSSIGQLTAYAGDSLSSQIAVYVGFSLSGGTGCGLFLDILYLLREELRNSFPEDTVTIIPVVMMPSTFTAKQLDAVKRHRAQVNAAQGLLDFTDLMEHLHQPNRNDQGKFEIRYPEPVGLVPPMSMEGGHTMPTIALVSQVGEMRREDISRSVASAIVAHVSSVVKDKETAGTVTNRKTFVEEMVDVIQLAMNRHKLGVGTHPFMPMMAATLIMPSRRIADILSKWVISDGLEQISGEIVMGVPPITADEVNQFLSFCGFGDFVTPNTFQDQTLVNFQAPSSIRTAEQLELAIRRVEASCATAAPIVASMMDETIKRLTNFRITEAMVKMLETSPEKSLPHVLRIAAEAVNRLNTGIHVSGDSSGPLGRPGSSKRRGSRLTRALGAGRPSPKEIKDRFQRLEDNYRTEIQAKWWSKWSAVSYLSVQSIRAAQDEIASLKGVIDGMKQKAFEERVANIADLSQSQTGVVNFVPTRGLEMSMALRAMYDETVDSIRISLGVADNSSGVLLSRVLSQATSESGWVAVVDRHSKRLGPEAMFEALLDPIRDTVEQAMVGSETRRGTLPSLATLLAGVASGESNDDVRALDSALGDLLPVSMVPPGDSGLGQALISYPGPTSDAVVALLRKKLRLNATYTALMDQGVEGRQGIEVFTATGESDHITVNINKPAQGLLDVPEIRSILGVWTRALDARVEEQVLWRQRLGYQRLEEIVSTTSAENLMELIVLGMAAGFVEVVQGSVENPEILQFRFNDDRQVISAVDEIRIQIDGLPGMSSWPNVPRAFARYLVGEEQVNNMRLQVLARIFSSIAKDAKRTDVTVHLPEQVISFLAMVAPERKRIRELLAKSGDFNESMVMRLKSALTFWDETVGNVAKRGYGQWKSLEVAAKEAVKESRSGGGVVVLDDEDKSSASGSSITPRVAKSSAKKAPKPAPRKRK